MKQHSSFGSLLWYECRKTFFTPMMLVFLAVLLLANGWKIADSFRQADEFEEYDDVYSMFYDGYLGEITEEKIAHLMTIYGPLEEKAQAGALNQNPDPNAWTYSEATDYLFFRSLFYEPMKYAWEYQGYAGSVASRAFGLEELFRKTGNVFETQKNFEIVESYQSRVLPEFAEIWSWELLLRYDYSSMILLFFTVFALSGMFVTEKESDMIMLLRTTKKGTGATVRAKLLAAALYTVLSCMLFYGQDFLTVYLMSGRTEALSQPAYILPYFQNTPMQCTLGAWFIRSALLRTLGIFVCGGLILLVSSLCSQSLSAFFVSISAMIGAVILHDFGGHSVRSRVLNPVSLLFGRELVHKQEYVPVFGRAVSLEMAAVLGSGLVLALLIGLIAYFSRGYHNRMRRRSRHDRV